MSEQSLPIAVLSFVLTCSISSTPSPISVSISMHKLAELSFPSIAFTCSNTNVAFAAAAKCTQKVFNYYLWCVICSSLTFIAVDDHCQGISSEVHTKIRGGEAEGETLISLHSSIKDGEKHRIRWNAVSDGDCPGQHGIVVLRLCDRYGAMNEQNRVLCYIRSLHTLRRSILCRYGHTETNGRCSIQR